MSIRAELIEEDKYIVDCPNVKCVECDKCNPDTWGVTHHYDNPEEDVFDDRF
jgi:hypothetical protein